MPKHFFFDLDNTLTRSKSVITPEHAPVLRTLCERADVIVVSGHGEKDIRAHLGPDLIGRYYILGQNGNFAELKDGTVLWNRKLSEHQKQAVYTFTDTLRAHLKLKVRDEDDIIEDRDSQIAYSLIGHHEDRDVKEAFDPDHAKRRMLLEEFKAEKETLERDAGVEVRIGGTTVLDFFPLGSNKGHNVSEFLKAQGWPADECLYIGDSLFPGGNDETVVGIIPTHAVKDYHETYVYLQGILKKADML